MPRRYFCQSDSLFYAIPTVKEARWPKQTSTMMDGHKVHHDGHSNENVKN